MIQTSFIKISEILDVVPEFVEGVFNIDQKQVIKQLQPIIKKIRKDVVCFIEYPYVDKFYRDSYYSFFSKKHNFYSRDSVRISIFDQRLDYENYLSIDSVEIENNFYGFLSLRPTTYRIIGHSFINPDALKVKNFVCALSTKELLIYGKKLKVHGFPFMSQDNESITCSEASLLNLMDYYSHKYPEYSSLLPSQLNKILSRHSFQRQLPARGLPTEYISYVLKKIGFGSVVYFNGDKKQSEIFKPDEFRRLMFMYIESGIPFIATLTTGLKHHAILVIGRKSIGEELSFRKGIFDFANESLFFSDLFSKVLVMNDNHAPFEMVEYLKPILDDETNQHYKFNTIIVPLYHKVHMDGYQFKNFFSYILDSLEKDKETKGINFRKFEVDHINRFFLASSKSYKNYISNMEKVSQEFKDLIVHLAMPKFVWVGEIILGKKISGKSRVKSIVVVDATESGLTGNLIFATNSNQLIFKKNGHIFGGNRDENELKYHIIDLKEENFSIFTGNLRGPHSGWQN